MNAQRHPPHWLIVDDDAVFTATLARGLQRQGHTCQQAHNGARALQLATTTAAATAIDRVVLDLRLGQESGLALLPALRGALPHARIIVLTGFASIATAVRAVKDGADDYLPKPVLLRDLLARFDALAQARPEVTQSVQLASANEQPTLGAATMSPRRLEWEHIQRVLGECAGNVSEAARRLGMHRRTLQRKLNKRPLAH